VDYKPWRIGEDPPEDIRHLGKTLHWDRWALAFTRVGVDGIEVQVREGKPLEIVRVRAQLGSGGNEDVFEPESLLGAFEEIWRRLRKPAPTPRDFIR